MGISRFTRKVASVACLLVTVLSFGFSGALHARGSGNPYLPPDFDEQMKAMTKKAEQRAEEVSRQLKALKSGRQIPPSSDTRAETRSRRVAPVTPVDPNGDFSAVMRRELQQLEVNRARYMMDFVRQVRPGSKEALALVPKAGNGELQDSFSYSYEPFGRPLADTVINPYVRDPVEESEIRKLSKYLDDYEYIPLIWWQIRYREDVISELHENVSGYERVAPMLQGALPIAKEMSRRKALRDRYVAELIQVRVRFRELVRQCVVDVGEELSFSPTPQLVETYYRGQHPRCLLAPEDCVCGRLNKAVSDKILLDNLDDGVVSSPDWWADPETYLSFTKAGVLKGGQLVYRTGQAVVHFFGLNTPKTVAQLTLSRSLASIAANRTGVVAGRFILAKAGIDAAGGLFFGTFKTLKKHIEVLFPGVVKQGSDGKFTWQLHHIVEQRNVKRFGAAVVHNTRNVVALPAGKGSLHQAIGAYYGKTHPYYRKVLREHMDTLSAAQQFELGVEILSRDFGLKLVQVESTVSPGVKTWVATNVDEIVANLPQIKIRLGLN